MSNLLEVGDIVYYMDDGPYIITKITKSTIWFRYNDEDTGSFWMGKKRTLHDLVNGSLVIDPVHVKKKLIRSLINE